MHRLHGAVDECVTSVEAAMRDAGRYEGGTRTSNSDWMRPQRRTGWSFAMRETAERREPVEKTEAPA